MEFIEVSAKTVDEAITKACIALGASSDKLEIQVISEGSSGFLGFGSKPAVIRAGRKPKKNRRKKQWKNRKKKRSRQFSLAKREREKRAARGEKGRAETCEKACGSGQ